MPTENMEETKKFFIKKGDSEKEEVSPIGNEVKDIFVDEMYNDNAIDAIRYFVESMTEGEMSRTIELSKDSIRKILKMYGLERITKKRFKKLLMGCEIQRNDTELLAKSLSENRIRYTPLVVQSIIETIMEEA